MSNWNTNGFYAQLFNLTWSFVVVVCLFCSIYAWFCCCFEHVFKIPTTITIRKRQRKKQQIIYILKRINNVSLNQYVFVCRWLSICVQKSTRYGHGNTPILKLAKANGSKWDGIENDLRSESMSWAEFCHPFWKQIIDRKSTNKDFVRSEKHISNDFESNWVATSTDEPVQWSIGVDVFSTDNTNRILIQFLDGGIANTTFHVVKRWKR